MLVYRHTFCWQIRPRFKNHTENIIILYLLPYFKKAEFNIIEIIYEWNQTYLSELPLTSVSLLLSKRNLFWVRWKKSACARIVITGYPIWRVHVVITDLMSYWLSTAFKKNLTYSNLFFKDKRGSLAFFIAQGCFYFTWIGQ